MKSCSCTIHPSGLPPTSDGSDARLRSTCKFCERAAASTALIKSPCSEASPAVRTALMSILDSAPCTLVSWSKLDSNVRSAALAGSRPVDGKNVESTGVSDIAFKALCTFRW